MADIEAGATIVAAQNEGKRKPGRCEDVFPEDKEAARAWGEKMKQRGYGQIGTGVGVTAGLIGGIGGVTGNWNTAVGAACGLFFGFVGGGMHMCRVGQQAIAYANGDIAYPFPDVDLQM